MKKILFLICIAASLLGCDKKAGNTPNANDSTKVDSSVTGSKPDAKPSEKVCDTKIVVNKSAVDSLWLSTNNDLICSSDANYIYLDISLIPNDATGELRAGWLRDNRDKINFDETNAYIAKSHKLASEPTSPGPYQAITLDQLSAKIKAGGGNFETDQYNKYLRISYDPGNPVPANRLNVTLQNNFSTTTSNAVSVYSIPLFRAVLDVNKGNLPATPTFEFSKGTVDGNEVGFFKLTLADSKVVYYNYTRIPDKKN